MLNLVDAKITVCDKFVNFLDLSCSAVSLFRSFLKEIEEFRILLNVYDGIVFAEIVTG